MTPRSTQRRRGESLRTVFGDVRAAAELHLRIRQGTARARRAAAGDDQVRSALAAWSECMAAEGYRGIGTPEAARETAESYATALAAPEAWTKEVALAVAHATCAARVDLDAVRRTAWEGHLVADLVAHEADLMAFRDLQLAALDRAQAALRDG